MPWAEAAQVAILGAIAAFTQAISGFGFSLLIVPPLSLVVGAKDSVVLANTMSSFVTLMMAVRLRGEVHRGLFARLFAAACVGMPLGLLVLVVIDPDWLQACIALLVMGSAALVWRRFRLRVSGVVPDAVAGLLSGILNTSTSMSGPPVVVYLQGRGIEHGRFRATLSAYFVAVGLVAVALFVASGRYDRTTWFEAAVALPALAAGWLAGNAVYGRLDPARFRGIVVGVLFVTAAIALLAALT